MRENQFAGRVVSNSLRELRPPMDQMLSEDRAEWLIMPVGEGKADTGDGGLDYATGSSNSSLYTSIFNNATYALMN